MNIRAWAFLIGKNKQLGYRLVVVPDILYAAQIPGRLDELRSNNLIEKPTRKIIQTQELGPLTCIYRVIYRTCSGQMYVDLQERPILWTEGIMLLGSYPNLELPDGIFEYINKNLGEEAKKFFLEGANAKMILSKAIDIEISKEVMAESIKHLKETLATLKEQEVILQAQLSDIDKRVKNGKTVTMIGIPLVLIVVGVIVIPVGLHMTKTANEDRKNPEDALERLTSDIAALEAAITTLEKSYK